MKELVKCKYCKSSAEGGWSMDSYGFGVYYINCLSLCEEGYDIDDTHKPTAIDEWNDLNGGEDEV